MTGLLQHGVWRGCADLFSVRLNLIEVMIEAALVSEVFSVDLQQFEDDVIA